MLLLSLSGYTTIVPSYSYNSPSQTNKMTGVTNSEVANGNDIDNDNNVLPSTATAENALASGSSVSDTSSPGLAGSQVEPSADEAAESPNSEVPNTENTNTIAVSLDDSQVEPAADGVAQSPISGEPSPDTPDTGSTDSSPDNNPANSDGSVSSPNGAVLNVTGPPPSSSDGITEPTSGSGNVGGDPSSGSGAPSANGTATDSGTIQSPGDNQVPDGNQSAIAVPSSGSNISSTETATGGSRSNASSTGSGSGSLINPSADTSLPIPENSVQAASSSDPNAVTQPISSGDGQVVNIGDISNTQNVSAGVSFDKNSYSLGDTVQVTVKDGDGNVDPNSVNTIQITIRSKSDQTGIVVTLTETGPNTGEFIGAFDLTDAASTTNSIKVDPSNGDNIQLLYDSSHPRAKATLDGVSQPGTAQISRVSIPDGDFSEVLVGNAINLTLSDGAQLAPNEATQPCLDGFFPVSVDSCGGSITVSMSYANAPLNNQIPSQLTVFQKVGGTWINVKDFGSVTVDENTQTVTAVTPFGPGIFTIGANIGGGGGGGGGLGFPGAGIVLDFLAPVTSAPPPSPPPSPPPATEPPSTEPDSTTSGVDQTTSQLVDARLNSTGASSNQQGANARSSGGQASGTNDGSLAAKTGNITIPVPGEGNITLVFSGLISQGGLSVQPVTDKSEIIALKIAKETPDKPGTLLTSNNTKFMSVGTVFKIVPTDARFNDTITVTIPYDAVLGNSEVHMLQYTGSEWQDVTSTPPANGRTVTGNIDALGPVVAAVRSS